MKCVIGHPPSAHLPSHTLTVESLPDATWWAGGGIGEEPLVLAVKGVDGGEVPTCVRAVT